MPSTKRPFDAACAVSADAAIACGCRGQVGTTAVPSVSDSVVTPLKPRIVVFGVGGGGGNAVNNMIRAKLKGVTRM